MTVHSTAAVIGGDIAGMSAAYELKKKGFDVTVFESRGRIWTVRKGDFLINLGTAVYLGTYREAVAMIHEVGLPRSRQADKVQPCDVSHLVAQQGQGLQTLRRRLQAPSQPRLRHLRRIGRDRHTCDVEPTDSTNREVNDR